jgi:hypothetical protein
MNHDALRCTGCGRLHHRISEAEARQLASACPGDKYEDYLRCGRCGTATREFEGITMADQGMRPGSIKLFDCVVPDGGTL